MKKTLSFLLTILILNVLAQKGVVIPTTPVTPQKSPSVSKPKPVNTAPKPAAGTEIWKVDATSTPCTLGQCMLIKKAGQKEFEIFEDIIEGFEFTEGNTYTLQVRQTLKQPPIQANESIYKYELVKVMASTDSKYSNISVPTPTTNTGAIVQIDLDYGTIACESGSEKQCFLLKEKGRKEYEIFNGCIYGFTYEAGNRYVLQARKNGEDYDFVKVIKKEFVEYNPTKISCVNQRNPYSSTIQTNATSSVKDIPATSIPTSSALDKKWYLRKMKESEGSSFTTDDNVLWIQISTFNDKLKGFGACNKFEAVVRTDLVTSFQISKLTSGYVNCGYKKLEELFYSVLQQADRFEIRNGNLILSKQWKYLMELTSDPNQKEETSTSTNYQPVALNTNTVQPVPVQSITPTPTANTPPANVSAASATDNKEVDELQKQVEELKKQLEAKKQTDAAEAQKKMEQEKLQQQQEAEKLKQQLAEIEKQKQDEAKRQKLEQEKIQKQKEIEELKRQIAEKEKEVTTTPSNQIPKSSSTNSSPISETKPITSSSTVVKRETETLQDNYETVKFTVNKGNNIPEPEYPLRPYYLDGNTLIQFERSESSFDMKVKGAGYGGVDRFLTAFSPESKIQFKDGNMPRIFISTESKSIDPYDVISLCKAITQKDRRRFKIGSSKMFGGARNVSGNIIPVEFKKIRDTLFEVIIPEQLEVGEYGFLPIMEGESNILTSKTVKINCFGIAP
ncbi:MAG: DUF4377 domain-containing protein [Sphingobacteriales bacterium]|jgi:hypothetical protein|nr:DUF4377 domain-containing protein [Sphingobacteriales bacterium]